LPGIICGKAVRSALPHAKILRIDTSKAKAHFGVLAVVTADDVPNVLTGRHLQDTPVLARERVRFIGKGALMDVPLCYFLAKTTGRPVKMIMNYAEELMAGNPRHPSQITIKTGIKADGKIWARVSPTNKANRHL
jgi:CO/xanthine dehydrogenase Mo-binding subunit